MDAAWQDFVKGQEVLIAMRFAYFGKSGWKSPQSRDAALLFEKDRLMLRLAMLGSLALPSLAGQTDQNFHLFVLTSHALPKWAKLALQDLCDEQLPGKVSIVARTPDFAHRQLSAFLTDRYGDKRIINTVLDDDDGLAVDFIAQMRGQLLELPPPETECYVSFSTGYGLVIDPATPDTYSLYRLRYPYINLGLTMVSQAGPRNIFAIAHRKTPRLFPNRLVPRLSMYVRSLHPMNDSRVEVSPAWQMIRNWRRKPEFLERFPYLTKL